MASLDKLDRLLEQDDRADATQGFQDEVLPALSALSRHKSLRKKSVLAAAQVSTETLASILQELANKTHGLNASDIGLALDWANAGIEAAKDASESLDQLLIVQGTLLSDAIIALVGSHKSTKAVHRARAMYVSHALQAFTRASESLRETYQPAQLVVKLAAAGTLSSVVEAALLVAVLNASVAPNFTSKLTASDRRSLIELWCKVVLSSKPQEFTEKVAPMLDSGVLSSFWTGSFVTQEDFDSCVVPALQKALLRAPEGVMRHVLPTVSINKTLKMDKLSELSSFVSNLGSSNHQLRVATAAALRELLAHTSSPNLQNLTAQLKKVTNSDQRALYASVLLGAPASLGADDAAQALASQAPKESSESCLSTIADALLHFSSDSPQAVEAVKKGLLDPRKQLRREWILALAERDYSKEKLNDVFGAELEKNWKEITDNVNGAAASKFASAGFAIILVLNKPFSSVPADLFGPRVYEHLSTDRESSAMARASEKLLLENGDHSAFSVLPAFAYSTMSGSIRQQLSNLRLLKSTFTASNSASLTTRFTEVLESFVVDKKVDVSKIVGTISVKSWFTDAYVLFFRPLASPPHGWIQACLRSGFDPHSLVVENSQVLFPRVLDSKNVDAMATLCFVAPDVIAPLVDSYLNDNLKGKPMSELDAAIMEAPEGQLVKLSASTFSSRAKATNKQSDEAWEKELRKEIAEKHGKLTPEQELELKSQSERRSLLRADAARVEFCCSLLSRLAQDLAKGAENGSLRWIPDGINLCLRVVNDRSPGHSAATTCLQSLSVCLSDRFKGHWKIRTANLLLQGKAADLSVVKSMLYMLNPMSDKRLLDPSTLVYILPIVRSTIARYKGEDADDDFDETILLVTSLLANQAEVLAIIPRGDLVQVLLKLLGQFAADRGAVKDCLKSVAQQVSFQDNELYMLLDASLATPQDFVRQAALEVIDAEVDLEGYNHCAEIWINRFGQFAEIAQDIWAESKMTLPTETILHELEPYFALKYVEIRAALAKSYAAAALAVKQVSEAFNRLEKLYVNFKQPPKPVMNEFGIEVKQKWLDPVQERLSVIAAMQVLVKHLSSSDVVQCAKFIVAEGVTDRAVEASSAAVELGKSLIDDHGRQCVDGLLPIFENDNIILFGFAAQHLPASDPRLTTTVNKLLEALPVSTDQNRNVVVECLASLATRVEYDSIVEQALLGVFGGETSAARKGAAFGFAGLTRGIGIRLLGDNSVVSLISSAVEDKKEPGRREGAQFLVLALSQILGRQFEPYAIELMPQVLTGLGDMNLDVREAANNAARSIMANTTAFGVKKQIPLALDQLDTTAWRGKKGAVELLGSMAYLSPQQLASSLATIVPEIVALLNDSHKEVRATAKKSMKMFGDVIQNPEIHKLVPTLLAAISDPTNKTDSALTDLLKTRFMHYIDSPSLALIIFVVQRGLRDRSANTKRKACQIVGNMSILTAGRDLVPYLPTIMPDLQTAMTDPVPQTCAVACKALGVLVEKLGEDYFPNVIPDMISTLQSGDSRSTGDRWGTAQGLAEVLHGLGTSKLDELLPEIVSSCQSPVPHIRQGFSPLLLLLPGSFGTSLTPYLSQLIPPLLNGLADQLDDVRDNSLKAGRRIVRGYATTAVDLLLPELEKGLWNPSWRIRLASVELVGDLLMELLGKGGSTAADRVKALASSKPTEDGETDELDATEAEEALRAEANDNEADDKTGGYVETNLRNLEVLGTERRDRVFAAIFICRADVVAAVRQTALDTWLSLIQNTPRAVKLILPTLVLMLLKRLSDDDEELQANAARALAELVRRVSGALKLIMPSFLHHLSDRDAREGICLGLVELIPATPIQSLQEHERDLMHVVRTCLQDSSNAVREAATRALEELHAALGDIAGDMLPDMVDQVVSDNDEGALAAIKEMLASTGASSVLSVAIPALLKTELDEFKATAIADLCAAAHESDINAYVEDIVDRLVGTPYGGALSRVLMCSCPEAHLLNLVKNEERLRANVFELMATYYEQVEKVDLLFVSDWTVFALHGLEEANETASAAVDLLRAISSSAAISKSELAKLSTTAYHTLKLLATPIDAFASAPKGPAFVLPIFINGLTLGSNLEKEESALAIAEIVRRTDPADSLKPVITQITGPLIRIVGERTASDVKAAIISTLNVLLTTIPIFLKPFLPQLQRTFAKNLADQSSAVVRTRAAMALGALIKLQTRIDPLTKEIVAGVRAAPDAGVRSAFLTALHEIICHAGQHLGDAVKESVIELIGDSESVLEVDKSSNDIKQLALFARIGADMVAIAKDNENPRKLIEPLIARKQKLQSVLNANALYVHAPTATTCVANDVAALLQDAARRPSNVFSENGVSGLGKILLNDVTSSRDGALKPFEESSVRTLVDLVPGDEGRSVESRRLAIVVLGALVEHHKTAAVLQPFLNELVVPLFTAARDRNIPVKIAAERTFLATFDFVARHDSTLFEEWFAQAKDNLDARSQRSLQEYVRRVAMRSATSDSATTETESPVDELSEVWAVGLE